MKKYAETSRKEFFKLSDKEFVILGLLINRGEMYGLEMVEQAQGELKRGTIYVTLQRMSEKGFIDSYEEERTLPEIGIPRRIYKATGIGERAYKATEAANRQFQIAWQTA